MTQPSPEEDAAPFTRAIDVSGLHEAVEIEARASEPECAAAARLLQLERIEALSGRATVKPQGGGRFILEGAFKAAVHPVCVISLAPFRQELSGRFKRHYTMSPPPAAAPGPEIELDADDSLYPDAIPGGALDFGILLTEELALALDPFPRAPGAVFQAPEAAPEGADSPFAALAQLKKP
ncbi:MAG: YceD family protein [Rhodospirillales bacterium]